MNEQKTAYEGFAILELMGHRRLGGYVRQVEQFGVVMCRIDIPGTDGEPEMTQFYGGPAIYALTPVTEEMARAVAASNRPVPVQRWELPAPKPASVRGDEEQAGTNPFEPEFSDDDNYEG